MSNNEKKQPIPGASYSYPTQAPLGQPGPSAYPPQGVPYPHQGPPPAYSAQPPSYAPPAPAGYPQPQPIPQQYYQPARPQVPPATVVVQGGFDAGARFDHGSSSLPPPPPGCMPTTSQMAAAQGHNVVVTQRKGNFLSGGSHGGYTFW
ncbi:unnamed protein product [Clavelina lepadiformis]|uniref:DAZ-associated protein 2 n=1 Tax=Clavelina lepadiformis TaxID=159417 RepID=A0ABP0GK08_CLALP